MRILGIDPGYGIVGFGIIDVINENSDIVECGCINTSKNERMSKRLNIIAEELEAILKKYKPDEIAIEELFFMRNITTAIPVAEARGVIILTCYKHCNKIFEYTPLQIKQALTGFGRAEKQQVQFMVKNILRLNKTPSPDDVADALAVALCHSQINSALNDNII
ncbi:MAG: crossover junction endodeoxyribonuclease RuvC [Clostridia bacterium]|nr:crossover junction endodeoxyribonuclease RuvC [Clostridia bacterium]MDD4686071.1 crossover junction endodeoxyribonuclease RuvC [Clostridia bacterium]